MPVGSVVAAAAVIVGLLVIAGAIVFGVRADPRTASSRT